MLAAVSTVLATLHAGTACADSFDWFAGEWSLTLGGAAFVEPKYEGANSYHLSGMPLVSIGRRGSVTRFSSINDSASFALIDTGVIRFGPTGSIIAGRDDSASRDLRGLSDVPWGLGLGAFLDVYPADWMRFRTEVKAGINSFSGVTADFALDAFTDITPTLRLSGGPRLAAATEGYFDAYYGVTPAESVRSGLAVYAPDGGFRSAGVGGALTWLATDKVTTSLFAEYKHLLGPAADSSLVRQRGDADQFTLGASATYRFDFAM
jgi:outer membrane scaffolding protein for murein synthesis (MipA/OmpV family)